ncbi:serine hydrolase domain-containing protein [Spirillospora sp. CA-294931]|uniref:serine hydrolase domain-containing protein n=1 Tax=Spirillospora sp. CA-294931 TaxID=3240042 RepID=UPI003D927BF8
MHSRLMVAGATLTAVTALSGALPAEAAPRPPAPTATTLQQAPNPAFDVLQPSGTPLPLRVNPRQLSVTYTYEGKQHTLDSYLARTGTQGFVVLDGQDIVMERYSFATRDTRFQSWSVAKSFTSAAFGIALDEGHIDSIDDPVTKYLPELRGSGYDGVSLLNVLRMSSGVTWNEVTDVPPVHVAASLGYPLPKLAAARVRGWEPGSRFNYTSMNSFVLGWVIARATGTPYHEYVEKKLWKPAGMESSAHLGNDSNGNSMAYCCYYATSRDFARFGLLFLRDGTAAGRQVVPGPWVKESTRPSSTTYPGYGLHWWIWGNDGSYAAEGLGGQKIYVSPKHGVVIAKNQLAALAGDNETEAAFEALAAEVARTRPSRQR